MGEKIIGVIVFRTKRDSVVNLGNGLDYLSAEKGWNPYEPEHGIDGYVHSLEIIDELKTVAKDWDNKPEEVVPATFDLETGEVIITGERKPFTW